MNQKPSKSFTRKQRLLTAKEYSQLFAKGKRVSNRDLTIIYYQPPKQASHKESKSAARLGLAVARKQVKSAVVRNRIKRVAREKFRHNQEILQGWDLVLMCRHSAGKLSRSELHSSVQELLDKVIKYKEQEV